MIWEILALNNSAVWYPIIFSCWFLHYRCKHSKLLQKVKSCRHYFARKRVKLLSYDIHFRTDDRIIFKIVDTLLQVIARNIISEIFQYLYLSIEVSQNTYMNWELYMVVELSIIEHILFFMLCHFLKFLKTTPCKLKKNNTFWNGVFIKKNTIINYKVLKILNFFLTAVKLVTVFLAGTCCITDACTPG